MGASYATIGIVIAAQELGTLIADMPAGVLLRNLGRKHAMLLGLAVLVITTSLLFWASSVYEAILLRFAAGLAAALFNVSRHQYLTEMVKFRSRGRAIAAFGGINRIGLFMGPAVGGAFAAAAGLRITFLFFGIVGGVALLFVMLFVQRTGTSIPKSSSRKNLFQTIQSHKRLLSVSGSAQLLMQTIRTGRNILIPLAGADMLGLDVGAIGTIMSSAAAVDMTLFYPTGWLMDNYGRRFAIVPSCLVMASGMALIPFTTGFNSLLLATCFIGFGNGLGSGTMMTLGADLSPSTERSEFLGAWHFIGDSGATISPIIVGGVAEIFILPIAALVLSASGISAAWIFARFVPETLKNKPEQSKLDYAD
jgi:MFS family permease